MATEMQQLDIKKFIETPTDAIEDGTITKLTMMTWREKLTRQMTDPTKLAEALKKFDNPEETIVLVEFETNKEKIKGDDAIKHYDPCPTNSKLGKITAKYGNLKVGLPIKIEFDGNGYSSIKYDKKKNT